MEYIESPESIQKKIDDLKSRLAEIDEGSSRSALLGRLAAASPFHPARLARALFMLLTILSVILLIVTILLPYTGEMMADAMSDIESQVIVPLWVLLSLCAVLMLFAWATSTQAALALAADCPLMPWELEEHQRIEDEIGRLASQKSVADRLRGTPMANRPRIATPVPLTMRSGGTPTGAPSPSGTGPGALRRAGTPLGPPRRSATPLGPPRRPATTEANAARVMGTPTQSGGRLPNVAATPAPAGTPARSATPLRAPAVTSAPRPGGRMSYSAPDSASSLPPPVEFTETDDRDTNPAYSPEADSRSFEQRFTAANTALPTFAHIDEPWLEDCLQKAEILVSGYPVQAKLEFSPEEGLPFALILERATPAMAVRAMVQYVEFLASIATPPRGRVEIRNTANVDRGFYRNVVSALDPYFPEAVEVEQVGPLIEIVFAKPDDGWERYPVLPFADDGGGEDASA